MANSSNEGASESVELSIKGTGPFVFFGDMGLGTRDSDADVAIRANLPPDTIFQSNHERAFT